MSLKKIVTLLITINVLYSNCFAAEDSVINDISQQCSTFMSVDVEGKMVCNLKIGKGLPVYKFIFFGGEESYASGDTFFGGERDYAGNKKGVINRIKITRSDNNLVIQNIKIEEGGEDDGQGIVGAYLLDVNFDGYQDIKLSYEEYSRNEYYKFLIFDPKKNIFIRSKEMDELTSPDFDAETRIISAHYKASYCNWFHSEYKIDKKGGLLLFFEDSLEPLDENANKYRRTTGQLVNGKMIKEIEITTCD